MAKKTHLSWKFHTKVSTSPQQDHNIGLPLPHPPSQFRPLKHTNIWTFIFKESNFPYSLLVYFAKIEWKNCILVHIADRNYVTEKKKPFGRLLMHGAAHKGKAFRIEYDFHLCWWEICTWNWFFLLPSYNFYFSCELFSTITNNFPISLQYCGKNIQAYFALFTIPFPFYQFR